MKNTRDIMNASGLLIEALTPQGGTGFIANLDRKKPSKQARVVWSTGGGWDHVSVSWSNRCPSWDEMVTVKNMFFDKTETVVQYHPSEDQYVNFHPYCLHLFRKQDGDFPCPPHWMVGPKNGESISETIRMAENELG